MMIYNGHASAFDEMVLAQGLGDVDGYALPSTHGGKVDVRI
jgi:hypothetical protein